MSLLQLLRDVSQEGPEVVRKQSGGGLLEPGLDGSLTLVHQVQEVAKEGGHGAKMIRLIGRQDLQVGGEIDLVEIGHDGRTTELAAAHHGFFEMQGGVIVTMHEEPGVGDVKLLGGALTYLPDRLVEGLVGL